MGDTDKTETVETTGTREAAAALMEVNPVVAMAWMDIVAEGTRFLAERLRQDVDTQKALLACKTPAELMATQSRFFTTAMEQYSTEVARLFAVMSKAAEDTLEDARTGHRRSYDDIPL